MRIRGRPAPGSLEALAASLCPPAEAFTGEPCCVPALIACRTGDPQPRRLSFLPLRAEDDTLAGVLGVASQLVPTEKLPPATPAHELHAELAELRLALARRFGTQSLICRSEGMLRVAGQVAIARAAPTAVLIWGEKGSGKEHIARAIHYESESRARAFVPLDCRVLTPLELEQAVGRLFGTSRTEEFFDSPAALHPGTIFLAHVERLPRDVQKSVAESLRAQSPEQPRCG